MKLYVVSSCREGKGDIDGIYYLIAENGECLASHWCSCKGFAKGDLYSRREERKEKYKKEYGEVEVLYLGDDDMTYERIIELNRQHAVDNGYTEKDEE